ncbi:MAG: thiolase domain-containing protein [Candidatus Nezhaarchaeota archaeon]|nr:thiolase domain-containing protein [Candidatus Nezhaarchaeota archaeon]MCX8141526.1 thiolase domain-containing protein [Candidatus Nezhaarchaeota archaeon]MDW8049793.1 beta-ketoacyl synthase N-terminal-like domain-containing protein [Nitrososphaerota archaeon]
MREVVIASIGYTRVSEHWEKSLKGLFMEASLKALENAGLNVKSLDGLYVANAFAGYLQRQTNLANIMAESLGFFDGFAISIDSGGASGGIAIHEAYNDVARGIRDIVLVCGVEKMSEASPQDVLLAQMSVGDQEHFRFSGITIHSLAALIYKTYMKRFNVKQEDIALMSVISHEHASTCSHAQFPFKVSLEAVMKAPIVSDPIRALEIPAPCDGAAAVIVCSHEKAKEIGLPHIKIAASRIARDSFNLNERSDLLAMEALVRASRLAYEDARIKPSDLSFVELYDDYTVMGVLALEKLGLCEPGEGVKLLKSGEVSLKGAMPVNTFGGLKARGAPVGAVGVYQAVEAYLQLVDSAGANQVKNARVGATYCGCCFNSIVVVNIFERCC